MASMYSLSPLQQLQLTVCQGASTEQHLDLPRHISLPYITAIYLCHISTRDLLALISTELLSKDNRHPTRNELTDNWRASDCAYPVHSLPQRYSSATPNEQVPVLCVNASAANPIKEQPAKPGKHLPGFLPPQCQTS